MRRYGGTSHRAAAVERFAGIYGRARAWRHLRRGGLPSKCPRPRLWPGPAPWPRVLPSRTAHCSSCFNRIAALHGLTESAAELVRPPMIERATPNRRAYMVPLARDLIQPLDRYLQHGRSRLAGPSAAAASTALWLSGEGRALGVKHAQHRICRHTAAAFGRPVNPHLFRAALATTIAVRRPELISIVAPLLGHRSVATA